MIAACLFCLTGAAWRTTAAQAPERARDGAPSPSPARGSTITRVQIDAVQSPAFEGREFGAAGRYERLVGRFHGELDPAATQNSGIVNIDRAPRNARGLVEYSADFRILKPIDMARGSGTLFYDVLNRGTQRAFNLHVGFKGAYGSYPPDSDSLGDGFLLERGYTLVWSGWQGDVMPGNGRLAAQLPIARASDGSAIRRWITKELIVNEALRSVRFESNPARVVALGEARSHPAVEESMPKARLYRRANAHAEPELVPRDTWSFAACAGPGPPSPSNIDVCMPSGLSPNAIYYLVYEAQDPIVMGIGLAGIRDFVSFLRHDATAKNPLVARRGGPARQGHPISRVTMFGQSQAGRVVKDLIYEGFNRDLAGRRVFDGAISMTGAARRTSTNQAFSESGRYAAYVEDHYTPGDQFPFSYDTMTDPVSGRIDGLLARCRATQTCPKIMQWEAGSETWVARASLVLTDPLGTRDLSLPEQVRYYFFSSTQHQVASEDEPGEESRGLCQQLANPSPYRETQRALLVAMEAWVAQGTLPPPSQHPKLSDGTLVPPLPQSAQGFPSIPGVRYTGTVNDLFINDYLSQPVRHTTAGYTVLVPKVDSDGNDIGGIRSTMLQAPLGTYTGWNLRRAGAIEGEGCGLQGSYIPFAKTAAERGADPRPSLAERYGTHARYVAQVRAAAERLQQARLLAPRDAARLIRDAEKRNLGLP